MTSSSTATDGCKLSLDDMLEIQRVQSVHKLSQRYSPVILPLIALPPRFSPERDKRDWSAKNIFTSQNMTKPVNLPFSMSVRYVPSPTKFTPEWDKDCHDVSEKFRRKWK